MVHLLNVSVSSARVMQRSEHSEIPGFAGKATGEAATICFPRSHLSPDPRRKSHLCRFSIKE